MSAPWSSIGAAIDPKWPHTILENQLQMRGFSLFLAVSCLTVASIPQPGEASDVSEFAVSSNWTFTYLKATENNKESLLQFVEKNWFVMDKVAVERGLFKSYRLIENMSESDARGATEWDFIVAVEYFEDQSYADIQQEFEEIRSEHQTVLIDGRSLRDLGLIVRSERVLIH